jgi:hypothetical protein
METGQQHKKQYRWLKEYQWKPGQSGNPAGKKPGKTLKEWAKGFLMELPDEQKLEFLKVLPAEIVWRMAEGNPHQSSDETITFNPQPIDDVQEDDSVQEDQSTQEEN